MILSTLLVKETVLYIYIYTHMYIYIVYIYICIYICTLYENKNYFSATEGEFKAQ